jgi:hypothetical protein
MGIEFAGVAVNNNDISSFLTNPAHSSLFTDTNSFRFRYGLTDYNSRVNRDLHNLVIAYNNASGKWGYGIGTFFMGMPEKKVDYTYSDGYTENVKLIGATGAGLNASAFYGDRVKIAVGLTLKSDFGPNEKQRLDGGLDLLWKILEMERLNDNMFLNLSASLGFAYQNFDFDHKRDGDENLELGRFGYAINIGVDYRMKYSYLKAFNLIFTAENRQTNVSDNFHEVFDLSRLFSIQNTNTGKSARGVILNFGETISFGTNQINNASRLNTKYLGISSEGVSKLIEEFSPNNFSKWMNRNLRIDYSYSWAKIAKYKEHTRSYNIDFTFKNLF